VSAALQVRGLSAGYSGFRILDGLDLELAAGRITAIVGSNGAGKSTLLRALAGLLPREGRATLDGRELPPGSATAAVRAGLILVAEGRHLFPRMTVLENLQLGGWLLARDERAARLERALALFPRLVERRHQLAGSMSGGEQQMLALARALMQSPRILLIDEPSVGLAPVLVARMIEKIKELKERYKLTVLMAEQNFPQALRIADRGYVIVHGQIAFEGRSAEELNNNDLIKKFYLGL
jgi:branched-chain amino acid transport system ATP-binding protein